MIKKGIKQGSAFVLTAVLAFSTMALPKVYAALEVDTDAACSVEINVTGISFKELNGTDAEVAALPVTVNLYKVADIDMTGDYTAVDTLESLDFTGLGSETTAAEWEALAAAAKAEVDADKMAVTASGVTENGVVVIEDLAVGLYLVDAQQVLSDYNQYDFTPYLISLPNNYYYDTDPANDTWVYSLTGQNAIGLKAAKSDRYGDLVINKILETYNASVGGATFVFQIEGSKTDIDTGVKTVVYSDVISMTFKNPGTDSITIQDIPAGAVVTVTEVYSGASYTVTSDASQTVTILADAVVSEGTAADENALTAVGPVNVNFENTYDARFNSGSGLVNKFAYDSQSKEWTHSATEDSTP